MDWTARIGGRIKLRDLHILLAVAETGSMAKAARLVAVSQPVVSKSIADLEHALGVRLFDRSSLGVEPTAFGQALLKRGVNVFDELRGGLQEITARLDPTVGTLRIGCNPAIGAGLLAVMLKEMPVRWPGINFEVRVAEAAAPSYRILRDRDVDVVLGRLVGFEQDDVHEEVLFQERLRVVAARGSKWVRRRKCALSDLAKERWTVPAADSFVGSLIAEAFRSSGLPIPLNAVASNSIHLQCILVAGGDFLSVLPGSFLHFAGDHFDLATIPIDLPIAARPVGIATLQNRTMSPVTKLFVEQAREYAASYVAAIAP